jgi:hypothetical protein
VRHELFPSEGNRQPLFGRQAPRSHLEVMADVKAGSGSWKRSLLSDISVSGFKIGWFPNAKAGQTVLIRIPGVEPLTAFIRRAAVEGIGCEFERPISAYVLDHLVRQSGNDGFPHT